MYCVCIRCTHQDFPVDTSSISFSSVGLCSLQLSGLFTRVVIVFSSSSRRLSRPRLYQVFQLLVVDRPLPGNAVAFVRGRVTRPYLSSLVHFSCCVLLRLDLGDVRPLLSCISLLMGVRYVNDYNCNSNTYEYIKLAVVYWLEDLLNYLPTNASHTPSHFYTSSQYP